jgi:hypothetical protein
MCLIPLLGGVARSAGVGALSCEAAPARLQLAELAWLSCHNWRLFNKRYLFRFFDL